MAIGKTLPPETKVYCEVCGWRGTLRDCVPGDMAQCPECEKHQYRKPSNVVLEENGEPEFVVPEDVDNSNYASVLKEEHGD